MTVTPSHDVLTAQDLWNLPDDGNRYELVRGVLVCMSPASLAFSSTGARAGFGERADVRRGT